MTTLGTQKLLAEALKKLLEEKDISKISISELTEAAGVNRKTFYYHFRNIYELLVWTFESEALAVVDNFDLTTDYRSAISFIMDYLEKNERILSRLARSHGRVEIRHFLRRDLHGIIKRNLDISLIGEEYDEDYRNFLAEFMTEAFTGVLLRWAEDPSVRDRAKLERYLSRIFEEIVRNTQSDAPTLQSGVGDFSE